MKKITLLFLPLFCLLLLGAGCADKPDFDEKTTTPSLENNVVPLYEINLDDGHIETSDGSEIDIEYTTVE